MKLKNKIPPYLLIILSFFMVIVVGTILLSLPISTKNRISVGFINAFFTTVTSVCVTGLTTIPNLGETFSIFGKIVITILMEIGGLSFLTLTIFFLVVFKIKLGISESFLMREQLNQGSIKDLEKLIIKIVKVTLIIQLISTVLFTFIFYFSKEINFNFFEAFGIAIFHSVSSFNNAGLDILGRDDSLKIYQDNILVNVLTMILIIIGGIGFSVLIDTWQNKKWSKLRLHTKITWLTTLILVVGGTILIKCSMWNGVTVLEALFLSVSTRTCGFSTFDLSTMSNACYCIVIILMFIGASSCSTGGGVKTSTVFVVVNFIYNYARGRSNNAFYRKISQKVLLKALALINFALIWNVFIILLICAIEPETMSFKDILFEEVSAFSTAGLATTSTSSFTTASKLLLCLSMFIGRVGPLTFMGMMNKNWLVETNEKVKYVEENIMIG